jgi:hypothetical protein
MAFKPLEQTAVAECMSATNGVWLVHWPDAHFAVDQLSELFKRADVEAESQIAGCRRLTLR